MSCHLGLIVELVITELFVDDIRAFTSKTSFPMRPGTWFGRFWTRIRAEVVQDVPPSLEECESCREVDCTQERWLTCARRLAAEAERRGAGDQTLPPMTGRTSEMPGIHATDSPQDQPAEEAAAESGDRRDHISSSGD
jgi:hypothetical protein